MYIHSVYIDSFAEYIYYGEHKYVVNMIIYLQIAEHVGISHTMICDLSSLT